MRVRDIRGFLVALSGFVALMAGLFAFDAGAQGNTPTGGPVSRGDLLKIRQYETVAATTYYVDPTGADTNACTATGVDACLTVPGAIAKVPKLLRHVTTIQLAAGSYAGAIVSGFTCDSGANSSGGSLMIQGTLANVTPSTGTATGTATGGSAGSTNTFGTLIDAGQTWTINNLQGKFIVITGGTGSGQIRPISTNTATTITIAGTWTAPTGTSTYAVQDSASIITSTVQVPATGTNAAGAAAGLYVASNVCGANTGGIAINRMKLAIAGNVRGIISVGNAMSFVVNQTSFVGANSSATLFRPLNNSGAFSDITFTGTYNIGMDMTTGGTDDGYSNMACTRCVFIGGGTAHARIAGLSSMTSGYFFGAGGVSIIASTSQSPFTQVLNSIVDCNNNVTVNGIGFSTGTGANPVYTPISAQSMIVNTTSISNCQFGVLAVGRQTVSLSAVSGTANQAALGLFRGATFALNGSGLVTITGTNEISVDSTFYTLAALRAATPKLISSAYGTSIWEAP